MISGFGATQNH